jgi:peptide-methionine (S)-S-oxide reductase
VVRTRVGYAGGTTAEPTYESIGDHSEAVEVEFDPARISYQDLLAVFWKAHDPASRSISRQYRTAVFWTGDEQRRLAEVSRELAAKGVGRTVATSLEPLQGFTPAEDYHQKYYLRSVKVIADAFHGIYPDEREFAASTAAARVNGYLGGHGGPERLGEEIGGLGLEGEARQALERIVNQMHPSESCPAPGRSPR